MYVRITSWLHCPLIFKGASELAYTSIIPCQMLDPDLRALNATNRRQENLSSTGPFNDGDWRDTRCNHPGAASNDLSTLQDHGSSRSEASEGVASAPSSHSLRRQSTREDGSHNKGRGHSRPPSPGHRERRNGPSRAESSSSLRQKRHRTDDERSRSRDRDTKRKKKEKGKLKDDSGEKRSILTGKKVCLTFCSPCVASNDVLLDQIEGQEGQVRSRERCES